MAEVTYIDPNGKEHRIEVPNGMTLMHGALLNHIPGLLAECGGAMICATCHIYIDSPWFESLTPPSTSELDKIHRGSAPRKNSRLACQIIVSDALNGIRVRLPDTQVWAR